MYRAYTLLLMGIWMAILPYLGFPNSWKNVLFILSGLVLVYFSYTLYKEVKEKEEKKDFDNFSENNNFNDKEI